MIHRKVFVAGHLGMVGSAICRTLDKQPEIELVTRTRNELDLVSQRSVSDFFAANSIDEVYLAGAKVGGIYANNEFPAEFIYDNLMIEANIINSAYKNGVRKLLFLGSSCIYPKLADQPMHEEALLSNVLEPTNEPYAIAKIAGIKLCESYNRQYGVDFRSVMPTNLYGPRDNFHPENSHVIPAMMRRFHLAKLNDGKTVEIWGTGQAKREFLHVDDMAAACVHVHNISSEQLGATITNPMSSHINVGTGIDCSIRELAEIMAEVVGYQGSLVFDSTKPDGAPRKLLNVDRINRLGWKSSVGLKEGLTDTYSWFCSNEESIRV
jgi:GDP-L-fucose synthase